LSKIKKHSNLVRNIYFEKNKLFWTFAVVLVQKRLGHKSFGTNTTRVGPLPCVVPLVNGQTPFLGETLLANVTTVRFFFSMHPHVSLEVLRQGESLAAEIAHVRLLPGVHSHVRFEISAFRKLLSAHVANEKVSLGVVHFHMSLQNVLCLERFWAKVAFVRGVDVAGFVRLHVIPEVIMLLEQFVAMLAKEANSVVNGGHVFLDRRFVRGSHRAH
jgi:hypothetical protein